MLIFKGRYKVHFNNLRDPLVQGCWFMTSSVLIEQGFLDPGVTGVNDLPEQVVVPSMVMGGRHHEGPHLHVVLETQVNVAPPGLFINMRIVNNYALAIDQCCLNDTESSLPATRDIIAGHNDSFFFHHFGNVTFPLFKLKSIL